MSDLLIPSDHDMGSAPNSVREYVNGLESACAELAAKTGEQRQHIEDLRRQLSERFEDRKRADREHKAIIAKRDDKILELSGALDATEEARLYVIKTRDAKLAEKDAAIAGLVESLDFFVDRISRFGAVTIDGGPSKRRTREARALIAKYKGTDNG